MRSQASILGGPGLATTLTACPPGCLCKGFSYFNYDLGVEGFIRGLEAFRVKGSMKRSRRVLEGLKLRF